MSTTPIGLGHFAWGVRRQASPPVGRAALVVATLSGAACSPADLTTCGPGTHLDGSQCVADQGSDTDANGGSDTDSSSDTDGALPEDTDLPPGDPDVCDDAHAAWPRLQPAVDAAKNGATLWVCPGTYSFVVIEGKTITLRSTEGADVTSIAGTTSHPAVSVDTAAVVLAGFTLTATIGDGNDPVAALKVDASTVTLAHSRVASVTSGAFDVDLVRADQSSLTLNDVVMEGNRFHGYLLVSQYGTLNVQKSVFRDNAKDAGAAPGAIRLLDSTATIENNLVVNNALGSPALGIADDAPSSRRIRVAHNTFQGNAFTGAFGMSSVIQAGPLDPEIVDNIVEGNDQAYGIVTTVRAPSNIQYNLAYNNHGGKDFSFALGATHNISEDPLFVDAGRGDFHLDPASPARDAGTPGAAANDVDGTRSDIGAYGGKDANW